MVPYHPVLGTAAAAAVTMLLLATVTLVVSSFPLNELYATSSKGGRPCCEPDTIIPYPRPSKHVLLLMLDRSRTNITLNPSVILPPPEDFRTRPYYPYTFITRINPRNRRVLWSRVVFNYEPYDVTVTRDTRGNVFLYGQVYFDDDYVFHYTILKISQSGTLFWRRRYDTDTLDDPNGVVLT